MLLLPLIGAEGEPDLALGCLSTKGQIGRPPRRFTITRMLREPLPLVQGKGLAPAFAEPPRSFGPPGARPNLRLVSSRD
ncbi:MAG: hypothetical protein ACKO56_06475 [Paracoccaceae bacterium]